MYNSQLCIRLDRSNVQLNVDLTAVYLKNDPGLNVELNVELTAVHSSS